MPIPKKHRKVTKKTASKRKTATKRKNIAKKKEATKGLAAENKNRIKKARSKRAGGSKSQTSHNENSTKQKKRTNQLLPVHCTLAPTSKSALLLPTSVIAAVIDYAKPTPVNETPQWFLGQIEWENRQIPVFNYVALIGGSKPAKASDKDRIMIVKSLSDSARLPFLGILISDIPKLISVKLDHLVHTGDDNKALGAFCHVEVDEQPAIIPDIDRLTHLVTHAAFGILPITEVRH